MQVPAYWPSFVGVHVVVNRDERAEMKKVITIDMLSEEDMEDMSDEEVVVDEGIDMAIVVADVVVIPDMSILACNFLVSGM
ncbi:hypothetical protein TCE0_018r06101 [Talaromyces pinophilus]|uniref:Uncharacterized protein n=1 Tax=Talaromyces pinophilus TaxID=128442 RepID=A0A510NWW1_TALPI|nr:hypothetical protein TCE0_018r06101 [Talaromyces pinophilus]